MSKSEEKPPFQFSRVFELLFASILGALTATLVDIYSAVSGSKMNTPLLIVVVVILLSFAILSASVLWLLDYIQWEARRRGKTKKPSTN